MAATQTHAVVSQGGSPLEIVDFVSEANLREVCWSQRFLDSVKREYNLRHRQAVVFCNLAQDRFRLVAVFYGMAVLVLPPIDPEDQVSLYLKIGEFLRQFTGTGRGDVIESLDKQVQSAQERLERRRRLAKAAVAKRSHKS